MPLTSNQQRIAALADELASRFAARVAPAEHANRFPIENWQDLHDSGYLRLVIPRRYGGEGASVLDMVIAQEHLARGDASTALGAAMEISVLGRALELRTWPEQVLAEICTELATTAAASTTASPRPNSAASPAAAPPPPARSAPPAAGSSQATRSSSLPPQP